MNLAWIRNKSEGKNITKGETLNPVTYPKGRHGEGVAKIVKIDQFNMRYIM